MTRFTPLCHTLSARNSNTLSPISRQRLVQNSFIDNMTAINVLNYSTVLNIISDFTREQKADESVVSALSICTHRYTKCTTKDTFFSWRVGIREIVYYCQLLMTVSEDVNIIVHSLFCLI